MNLDLKTSDPSRTSLPVQIAGFAILLVGCIAHSWPTAWSGTTLHLAGDAWFFFQLKARGAI